MKGKPTPKQLKTKIDNARREYVRKRDLDFREGANCISCGKYFYAADLQVGHYHSRGYDFTSEIGKDERNVNLQCVTCNGNLFNKKARTDKDYAVGLERKYGYGILEELQKKHRNKMYWKLSDLQALLVKYKT